MRGIWFNYRNSLGSRTSINTMKCSVVPARRGPMMTTASSVGTTVREMMIWSLSTAVAAITTGSMLVCGIEPCAPRPKH